MTYARPPDSPSLEGTARCFGDESPQCRSALNGLTRKAGKLTASGGTKRGNAEAKAPQGHRLDEDHGAQPPMGEGEAGNSGRMRSDRARLRARVDLHLARAT